MSISVIGLGKLGTPLLAVLAAAGYDVVGVDTDLDRVNAINAAHAPIQEPGVQALLDQHRGRYRAIQDVSQAVQETDATFVIVPTPSGPDGGFTLEYLEPVARAIGAALTTKSEWHLVVIVSTVMPGQTAQLARTIEASSVAGGPQGSKEHGRDFGLCYSPTFIALGRVVRDLQEPDYVLIGAEGAREAAELSGIYRNIHGRSVPNVPEHQMNWVNAEIAKIAQNAYITMKITFANQLGQLCSHIPGAHVDSVTAAMGSDSRIGHKYLKAGTAYGGPCFPRDNRALAYAASKAGSDAYVLYETTDYLNNEQHRWLFTVLSQHPGIVGLLGMTYKQDTPSAEESAGLYVARALIAAGRHIVIYDPAAIAVDEELFGHERVVFAARAESCIDHADVVVLMHDDPAGLVGLNFSGKTVIDPWRLFHSMPEDDVNHIQLGVGSITQGVTV
jgi:UDPglucose 6-dehydrogenase